MLSGEFTSTTKENSLGSLQQHCLKNKLQKNYLTGAEKGEEADDECRYQAQTHNPQMTSPPFNSNSFQDKDCTREQENNSALVNL